MKCNGRSKLLSLSAQKRNPQHPDSMFNYGFLVSHFPLLKVYGFTLIHIYYYPTCFIPRDYENKIRLKKKGIFFVDQMTLKTRNINKGQNKQFTNLLIRALHFFNGFNIFPYLFRDITVFPFLSFIFSSESQVHSSCLLLLSLRDLPEHLAILYVCS